MTNLRRTNPKRRKRSWPCCGTWKPLRNRKTKTIQMNRTRMTTTTSNLPRKSSAWAATPKRNSRKKTTRKRKRFWTRTASARSRTRWPRTRVSRRTSARSSATSASRTGASSRRRWCDARAPSGRSRRRRRGTLGRRAESRRSSSAVSSSNRRVLYSLFVTIYLKNTTLYSAVALNQRLVIVFVFLFLCVEQKRISSGGGKRR
uniref:(northern house mosquito) hypothetical protein n=2 Tax=Culex pipiens TaxID=7175 RepID=A0A8D8GTQ5_CULPI